MDENTYRYIRPDIPLADWVRQQNGPVIVSRRDLPGLLTAGVTGVTALPYGGPHPGEVWVPR